MPQPLTVRQMGSSYQGLVNPDAVRPVVMEDDGYAYIGNPFAPIFDIGIPAVEEAECDETPVWYLVSCIPSGSGVIDKFDFNVDLGADFALRQLYFPANVGVSIVNFTDPRGENVFMGKFGGGIFSPGNASAWPNWPVFPEMVYASGQVITVQVAMADPNFGGTFQIGFVGANLYKR